MGSPLFDKGTVAIMAFALVSPVETVPDLRMAERTTAAVATNLIRIVVDDYDFGRWRRSRLAIFFLRFIGHLSGLSLRLTICFQFFIKLVLCATPGKPKTASHAPGNRKGRSDEQS